MPKRKKTLRQLLPSERCPFCKNVTSVHFECDCCGTRNFATCSNCRNYGAPSIRAPRRMITVYSRTINALGQKKEGIKRMCYPQCARKSSYQCAHCNRWHDRSLLHALRREQNNYNTSLCKDCNEKHGYTICSSCHTICQDVPERRDSSGTRCQGCFSSRAQFTTVSKCGPAGTFKTVIKTPGATRTYGIELEINSIHNCDNLARELGKLNIDDIEFEVKRDGSIHSGFEVVSFPADLPTLKKAVEAMCTSIRKYKHNYDNAGMHVHVKDDTIDLVKLFKIWYCVEGFHLACLPVFRRNNGYCYAIVDNMRAEGDYSDYDSPRRDSRPEDVRLERVLAITTLEQARAIATKGRYHTLNMRALDKYGTIEFRAHHATTDYQEITHFLTFLDYVYRATTKDFSNDKLKTMYALSRKCLVTGALNEFKELGTMLELPTYTLNYLTKRKDFYDKNPNVTSKVLGVPRRFRFDNGDSPVDITRGQRPASAGRRFPSSAGTGRSDREESEQLTVDTSSRIIRFSGPRTMAAVHRAVTLAPDVYSFCTAESTIHYLVARNRQGNEVWAYTSRESAQARSHVIRREDEARANAQMLEQRRIADQALQSTVTFQ